MNKLEELEKQYAKLEEKNRELEERNKYLVEYRQSLEQDLFENCSNYVVSKDKIREKLQELRDKEQELSDEQGYWGSADILAKIEILEELLEEG